MVSGFRRRAQVDWRMVDPDTVSHLVFVCGPAAGSPVQALFSRFRRARRICVGVSVVDGTSALGADIVIERDQPSASTPDLSFGAQRSAIPVVGVVVGHPQPEYGERQRHGTAQRLLEQLVVASGFAPVLLDTRLDPREQFAARTPAQLESALARMDVVVTTRLHGLVLALRNGVPALAVDPVAGGAKVSAQAAAIGWPAVVRVEAADADALGSLLTWCMSPEARLLARTTASQGRLALAVVRGRLLDVFRQPDVAG